jgi:trehalose 6-phosphate synthase/phosphatase
MNVYIVSNRLPVKIVRQSGTISTRPSSGGLVTGIQSLHDYHIKWSGWPGNTTLNRDEKKEATEILKKQNWLPVWMTQNDQKLYYKGFSNETLWPLFHYFVKFSIFNESYWKAYIKVNRMFCDHVVEHYEHEDIIWIQDYHLMLLPQMLRKKLPHAKIGFFLHIPFPHYEVFHILPWREAILIGLSGADLIGFHTPKYARYFEESVSQIMGVEINHNEYNWNNRHIRIGSFPMGIDPQKFSGQVQREETKQAVQNYQRQFNVKKILISVDRLDYTKGIIARLDAYYRFLEMHKEYKNKVVYLMLTVPSRTSVAQYQIKKQEIDEHVGRINGKFGTPFWTPIHYFYRSLDFEHLCALYAVADIALVTPFRDGMNLVAKEWVICKKHDKGVLILSEFAGAAEQLKEALIVNPFDTEQLANTIQVAMKMPEDEQYERLLKMQHTISTSSVQRWAQQFMVEMEGQVHDFAGLTN